MMKLDIQMFADGKVVIDTELNSKNFENGLSRMQSATKTAGSTIKSIVAGLGISKIISQGINMINSSLDTAITRFDTLNNFPKVMSNLGISAGKSQKSIDKLADKLQGLPTTLQDAALSVQRFTASNGDVEKSTDMFLALNNAILAGGAPMANQQAALEQLTQAYGRGKFEANEWKSLLIAMPAQLKQLAKSMGYTSTAIGGDFYEAVQNGTISMDDMMNKMIELNEKGGENFAAWKDQAKGATEGIATSITVLKGRVAQGVTSIIESVDKKLKSSNLGGISELIINFANGMRSGLKSVGKVIEGDTEKIIIDWLKKIKKSGPKIIENFTQGITDGIPGIIDTAGNILIQFVDTLNANIPAIYEAGVDIITTLVNSIGEQAPDLISSAVDMMVTAFMTITNQENLDKITQAGADLVMKLIEGILQKLPELMENSEFMTNSMGNVLSGGQALMTKVGTSLVTALITGILKAIPELLASGANLIIEFFKHIGTFAQIGAAQGAHIIAEFIKGIKKGIGEITKVGGQLIDGLWKGIQKKWNELKDGVANLGKGIVNKFKEVFGIKSPSKVMRDQVGKWLPLGMYEGFEDELSGVYKNMQKAINFENAKLQANVETGKVFNTLANTTPIAISLDADVEMDKTKVGRIITPVVSETLKTGGLR